MVTDAFSDFVVGHGELWCAQLFASTVRQRGVSCHFMDTREVLVVTSPDGKIVDVEYAESDARLDKWAQKHGAPEVSWKMKLKKAENMGACGMQDWGGWEHNGCDQKPCSGT